MGNCLLTQLKVSVDNPNLKPMSYYTETTRTFTQNTPKAFTDIVAGKWGLFRLKGVGSADGQIVYSTSPSSLVYALKTGSDVHISIDFRKLTGTLYGNLTIGTEGDFTLEMFENSFYLSNNELKSNYGIGGYGINTNNGTIAFNTTYFSNLVMSELIPTTKTVTFVSEGYGNSVEVFKYAEDGTTFLGFTILTVPNDGVVNLSQINASYVRFQGENTKFTNNVLFSDVR